MEQENVNSVGVFVTKQCNISCKHCMMMPTKGKSVVLNHKDCLEIVRFINDNNVNRVIFTGGEPLLEIGVINEITDGINHKCDTLVISNGWFGSSQSLCGRTLKKLSHITHLRISYDNFHSEFVPAENIQTISKYCLNNGIDCAIYYCISTPTDLVKMKALEAFTGIRSHFQEVAFSGNAISNECHYKRSGFDERVLDKKCPKISSPTYLPGLGFANCCDSIFMNRIKNRFPYKNDYGVFMKRFYGVMHHNSFRGVLNELKMCGYQFNDKDSHQCVLCQNLWEKYLNRQQL